MKKILAIGGAVIKTAFSDLVDIIEMDEVEILMHNGGSIFHDFQIGRGEIDINESTSYPLSQLLKDGFEINRPTSDHLWRWLKIQENAPPESITGLCERKGIPVLLFTAPGADFWQMFDDDWQVYAKKCQQHFNLLSRRTAKPFHYINQGSAVIHPEVFLKAIAKSKARHFRADVVDFLDMYRPRTRVAPYGRYYEMTHKEFFLKWKNKEIEEFEG